MIEQITGKSQGELDDEWRATLQDIEKARKRSD
jgi:hypothetical protein